MKQYLLAVYSAEGGPDLPSEEEMQRSYQAVDAFNSEVQAAGAWVFATLHSQPLDARAIQVLRSGSERDDGDE